MILAFFARLISGLLGWLEPYYLRWTRLSRPFPALDIVLDLSRPKPELLIENAFLRQQLVILQRQVRKPRLTRQDRLSLLLVARLSWLKTWSIFHAASR